MWVHKLKRHFSLVLRVGFFPWLLSFWAIKVWKCQQDWFELAACLAFIRRFNVKRVVEIGVAHGGTLNTWARFFGRRTQIIGIDINLPSGSFSKQTTVLQGDSSQVLNPVRELLDGHPMDLLFIDGDHEYEAVLRDLRMYGPLVRPGGLIVLHDIQPDYSRRGLTTSKNSGDVWKVWQNLKSKQESLPFDFQTREMIRDPEQDGYGLGLLLLPPLG